MWRVPNIQVLYGIPTAIAPLKNSSELLNQTKICFARESKFELNHQSQKNHENDENHSSSQNVFSVKLYFFQFFLVRFSFVATNVKKKIQEIFFTKMSTMMKLFDIINPPTDKTSSDGTLQISKFLCTRLYMLQRHKL